MQQLSILHGIDKPNELFSKMWALVPPSPPSPSPSLPFLLDALKNENVQKGSRFEKYVSEKGVEFDFKQDMY